MKILFLLSIPLLSLSLSAQTATVNWTSQHQQVDGFGASDESHGSSMSSANQNFFFGTGSGQLGLSILRVGLTNGSQDAGSCTSVGTSCAGVYVSDMQAMIANGGKIYASPWSPPSSYTTNGSTICQNGGGNGQLATGSYANYATWIANFQKSLQAISIPLYAVSIQNEPNICQNYDSALYSASQIDSFIKSNLGPTFSSNGISTLILTPEASDYSPTAGLGGTCAEDSSCASYLGGYQWHDYDASLSGTSVSPDPIPSGWPTSGKRWWETEASCGSGFGPGFCQSGFNTDITDALDWAAVIDQRMQDGANAWLYWQFINFNNTDDQGLTSASGTVAQRAYMMGNYAKYCRPGSYRIDATHNPQANVSIFACQNTATNTLSIVAINFAGSATTQAFSIANAPTFTSVTPVVTSATQNLVPQSAVAVSGNAFSYALPAQSITTFVGTASSGGGPLWSGLLASSRADANWPNVGAQTIPTGTIPNCATQPSSNTTAAINAAFTADAGGSSYCQINIPAGTYNISGTFVLQYAGIANVILNGAGPNQTYFVWTGAGNHSCNGLNTTNLCVWNGDSGTNAGPSQHWANSATITGGLTQGSTTLTLSSISGSLNPLTVGTLLQFAQTDPSSDTGNVWYCSSTGATGDCSMQGGGFSPAIGGVNANLNQEVYVKSCGATAWGATCTSTNVVLSSPIKSADWSYSNSPTAWWPVTKPIENVGVQNISLDVSGVTAKIFTECHDCKNVWFSNDRFINGTVAGQAATNILIMWQGVNMSIFNSYMYGSNPQSEGYGIDWDAGTSDSHAYNNIAQHIETGYMIETGTGNVYDNNFAVDNYFGSGWQQCDNYAHAGGTTLNLFEQNQGICIAEDDIHGTANYNTYYREFMNGFDPATETGVKYDATVAVGINSFSRYANIFASVFGTAGYHNVYQNLGVSGNPNSCPSYSFKVVYTLGFGNGNQIPNSPACIGAPWIIDNDDLVYQTLARWANYDVVNGSVQENLSETASTAPLHPGLANPSTTFPASFVYTSTPSWWHFPGGTTAPFPACGPDVTGGNLPGLSGYCFQNPANNCYHNQMGGVDNGSSGPLQFNPAVCYPTSGPVGISLTISTAGSGTGTISGPDCLFGTSNYTSGTSIGPCAAAGTNGSTFTGWSSAGSTSCTGNGTCPSSGSFSLTTTTTITATFTGGTATCANPSQNAPNSGTYTSPPTPLPLVITWTNPTAGCVLHYTTDGSAPSSSSPVYPTGGLSISITTTIRVIAIQSGYVNSGVVGGTWTIQGTPAAAPTFTPTNPYSGGATTVTAATSTSGGGPCIYFDANNPPVTNATTYSFTASTTLYAYVHNCPGYSDSPISTWVGTLITPTLNPPTFSPNTPPNNYLPTQFPLAVTPNIPAGSTGCYRTDGIAPTAPTAGTCGSGSSTYTSGTISITANQTLQMLATEVGYVNSSILAVTYNQREWILDTTCSFNGGPATVSSATCSPASAPTAGDLVTVGYVIGNVNTTGTVTDNVSPGTYGTVNAIYAGTPTNASSGRVFRANIAAVLPTVTLTLSGPSQYVGFAVEYWKPPSGCSNAIVDTAFTTAAQAGTTANPTLSSPQTPSSANELVYANLVTFKQAPTAGFGTLIDTLPNGPNLFPQYLVQSTATSSNLGYTMPADKWQIQPAAFECAATVGIPSNVKGAVVQGANVQ